MGVFGSSGKKGMVSYEVSRDSSHNAKEAWSPPADWDFVGVANGSYSNSVSLWFRGRSDGALRVITGFFEKEGSNAGKLFLDDFVGEFKSSSEEDKNV